MKAILILSVFILFLRASTLFAQGNDPSIRNEHFGAVYQAAVSLLEEDIQKHKLVGDLSVRAIGFSCFKDGVKYQGIIRFENQSAKVFGLRLYPIKGKQIIPPSTAKLRLVSGLTQLLTDHIYMIAEKYGYKIEKVHRVNLRWRLSDNNFMTGKFFLDNHGAVYTNIFGIK